MALLALHKLHGDPRGRGAVSIPWELFILWRLSLIARLQGKTHDAEYVEEISDSVRFDLRETPFDSNRFYSSVFSNPFTEFERLTTHSENDEEDYTSCSFAAHASSNSSSDRKPSSLV